MVLNYTVDVDESKSASSLFRYCIIWFLFFWSSYKRITEASTFWNYFFFNGWWIMGKWIQMESFMHLVFSRIAFNAESIPFNVYSTHNWCQSNWCTVPFIFFERNLCFILFYATFHCVEGMTCHFLIGPRIISKPCHWTWLSSFSNQFEINNILDSSQLRPNLVNYLGQIWIKLCYWVLEQ